ncbi:MAG: GMC family oxidoreductase [Chloroflexota bacterium]
MITYRERATLITVCGTFVPEGSPGVIADAILAELAAIGRPKLLADLRLFLKLIDSRMANLALVGRPVRFSDLDQHRRETYLRRWADSRVPLLRSGFQAVKRLALYLAYSHSDAGATVLLPETGYLAPDPLPLPDVPLAIRSLVVHDQDTLDCDVCVVGSGAGGAVAAFEAAKAGRSVIVLERGPAWTEADLVPREAEGTARLFWDRGLAATEDLGVVLFAGSALGGGTVVNWMTSLRIPGDVREEWGSLGVDGMGSELDGHYDAVAERSDVNTDESARNAQNSALARGLDALGKPWSVIPRNARGCGDCGHCGYGCRAGAKRSTARTFLTDAVALGARVVTDCNARTITTVNGAVTGVTAQAGGRAITVRAPRVVLAGGSIGTPALLLRSGLGGPLAGQRLFLHPVPAVFARYADPIRMWSGVPQTVVSDAFARLDGAYGFRLEVPPVLPGVAAAGVVWRSAEQHRGTMRSIDRFAAFIPIVRDREPGRVHVDRDGAALVSYQVSGVDRAMCVRAIVETAKVHLAAGAREVHSLHTRPLLLEPGGDIAAFAAAVERRGVAANTVGMFSAHQMGTAGMGGARESVADPDGAVRGVRGLHVADASALPNASGVNPMLTVMALARRNARRMLAG